MADDETDPLGDIFDPLGGGDDDPLGGDIDLGEDIDPLAGDAPETPDPLADVEYSDDLAADSGAELSALEQGYRDRAKAEEERFRAATDTEYWVAVCFPLREDKDAFLAKHGLAAVGDKYLDGRTVDRILTARSGG